MYNWWQAKTEQETHKSHYKEIVKRFLTDAMCQCGLFERRYVKTLIPGGKNQNGTFISFFAHLYCCIRGFFTAKCRVFIKSTSVLVTEPHC